VKGDIAAVELRLDGSAIATLHAPGYGAVAAPRLTSISG
jgi:hypothetical protein